MTTRREAKKRAVFLRGLASVAGAIALTLLCFLVLPVMQTIGNPLKSDMDLRDVDIANLPPPPPPPAQEEPEEEEPPEEPPKLIEEAPPLDLSQLELALNPGGFGDGAGGAFAIDLGAQIQSAQQQESLDDVFSAADLDQRPRPIFQRPPTYPQELRKQGRQGTVYVLFQVDKTGRVVNPRVEKSTDPAFEKPALDAVRQWRFEPGTRKGEKVQFAMRIPITFNPS